MVKFNADIFAPGLIFSVAFSSVFLCGVASVSAEVSDPFSRSAAEASKAAPSILIGEGAKKALPPIGEKGAKKAAGGKGGPGSESASTEITAKERLVFDQKGNQAVFVGDVVVTDPRFSLNCGKLTAVLRRSVKEVKDPLKTAAKEDGVVGPKSGVEGSKEPVAGGKGGGIDKAIAEGNVVIFQEKWNDKGELERSIGRAQKAVFDSETGDITLSGWPQVEQKLNLIVSLEESTVIVLNRKGTLDVQGHSKTILRNTGVDESR